MSDTTFAVSPEVKPNGPLEKVDYIGKLRTALRRPGLMVTQEGETLVVEPE